MAPRREWALVTLLAAIVAFGPLTSDLYLPSLPSMKRALDADTSLVQLTLSLYLVGFACAQLVIGPLSDRFGRRPVLLAGITLYFVASLACAAAPTIEALIALRFVQALGACSGPVLGRAVARDLFGRTEAARVLAYMSMVMALAPAVAPLIGGVLEVAFGWRSNFLAMAAFGAAVWTAVFALLPESNRWPDRDALRPARLAANYLSLARHPGYRAYVAIVALSFGGLFAWISGAAFVLIEAFAIAPDMFGVYFLLGVVGFMIGAFASARLTRTLGIDCMLLAGALIQTAAGLLIVGFALTRTGAVAGVVGPTALYLMGCGFVLPNGLAAAIGPFPRMAGAASAVLGFTQMIAGGLAGYLVGRFYDGTPVSLSVVLAACGLAALAVFALSGAARRGAAEAPEEALT